VKGAIARLVLVAASVSLVFVLGEAVVRSKSSTNDAVMRR